jgi:membrane-associated phospholipid phosphatase
MFGFVIIAGLCVFVLLLGGLISLWRWLVLYGEQALTVIYSIWNSQKKAFSTNPFVHAWTKRHIRSLIFFSNHLTRKKFSGLPLTILAIAFLCTLFLLIGITDNFLSGNPIVAIDIRLDNLLYAFRSPQLLHFFYIVTLFGASGVVITMTLVLSSVLLYYREKVFILTLFLSLAVSETVTFLAKIIFHRARPDLLLRAVTEDSFSFPSGHATTAMAFYGFIAYLIMRTHKRWFIRVNTFFFAMIGIFLIDFSRLYLGVHYLSDVLAGDLVGLAGLLFAISVTELFLSRTPQKFSPFPFHILAFLGCGELFLVIGISFFTASPWVRPSKPPLQLVNVANIPALFDQGKLPRYTESLSGIHQEPPDIIIIAKDSCLVPTFQQATWTATNPVSIQSLGKAIQAAIFNNSDLTAPVTPAFYDTHPNDFGFEKETATKSVRSRHHARFWKTQYETPMGSVFVGTVSLDTGIKWGITHAIAPDIDTERDLVTSDLEQVKSVSKMQVFKLVPPTLGKNFTGDAFFTDGEAVILTFPDCKQ